jgi:hypothetical protein
MHLWHSPAAPSRSPGQRRAPSPDAASSRSAAGRRWLPTASSTRALTVRVIRAAAAPLRCAVGAWLIARPSVALAAAMRRPTGRLEVLASKPWPGVHFLAR